MTSGSDSAAFEAVILFGVIVFTVIVATAILAYLRRRMRSFAARTGRFGFDLAQLRRLKDDGQLSADEYDCLVQSMHAEGE